MMHLASNYVILKFSEAESVFISLPVKSISFIHLPMGGRKKRMVYVGGSALIGTREEQTGADKLFSIFHVSLFSKFQVCGFFFQ